MTIETVPIVVIQICFFSLLALIRVRHLVNNWTFLYISQFIGAGVNVRAALRMQIFSGEIWSEKNGRKAIRFKFEYLRIPQHTYTYTLARLRQQTFVALITRHAFNEQLQSLARSVDKFRTTLQVFFPPPSGFAIFRDDHQTLSRRPIKANCARANWRRPLSARRDDKLPADPIKSNLWE